MADHDRQGNPGDSPDYDVPDVLELTEPAQYRALFEPTRQSIVSLLHQGAATTAQLAVALDKPKGTIGHHLQVLHAAGLIRVVRTERVRAIEAKYYGRTARVFLYHREHEAIGQEERILNLAATEIGQAPPEGAVVSANARYLPISAGRAQEWKQRLDDLLVEFAAQDSDGDVTYALVYGLYPTDRPPLPRSRA